MRVAETALPGVLLVEPRIFRDPRGAFWETWNQERFEQVGLPGSWVQDNCSVSRKHVVRGIHYQVIHSQAKLIRVAHGSILDVAVDLRRSSTHFGHHVKVELSAEQSNMLYIPVGFGHGFAALTEDVVVTYKVTDVYCPEGERTILWNDPELAIPWLVSSQDAIVSGKDAEGKPLREAEVFA